MLLAIEGLSVNYGRLAALRGVSVSVEEGQFVAIVGPNGAGKTTLSKAISGVVPAGAGAITYEGRNLLAIPAHQRMHLGIAHVPEGRQVFAAMTVLETLEMGAYSGRGRSTWQRNLDRIFALFPVLAERRSQLAGTLSGGEQQMLAIGRGIASSPQLLLLDEPSMGLAPAIADLIFDRITALHREDGVTLLLVEQRVAEALESCDYGYVLETGRVVLEGTHRTLTADDRVRRAYLGMEGLRFAHDLNACSGSISVRSALRTAELAPNCPCPRRGFVPATSGHRTARRVAQRQAQAVAGRA